jgi:predicted  nucleic acid-binding Zn-ribbon protein
MQPELEQMLILQDKDQHLRRLRLELKKLPAEEERAKAKLAGDTQAVQAARETVQHNEVAVKNLELQIQTRRDTITKLKIQQFETRKNEEFKAIGHEIERYTAEVGRLEDDELALMEKGESLKAAHAAAVAGLKATESLVAEELGRIGERRNNLNGQAAEFETVRAAQAAKLPEELLERYDRIFQHRGDAAVVPLEHGVCGGCHMKVTASCVATAKTKRVLTTCPNCARFVYLGD